MPDNQPGIELKLENGNVIKADNAEEALKIAAKMIEDNSKYAREMKSKYEEMDVQFKGMAQKIEELTPKPVPTSGFSKDTYYQLLHDDPIKAQNYVDAARFGMPSPEAFVPYVQERFTKVDKMDGNTLAAQFTNNHQDFPQDEDSAKALAQRVRDLNNQGYPVGDGTLDLAYYQLVREKKITPVEPAQEEEYLPPSPTGAGSAISMAEMQKAENMSDAELSAYLKSKGML